MWALATLRPRSESSAAATRRRSCKGIWVTSVFGARQGRPHEGEAVNVARAEARRKGAAVPPPSTRLYAARVCVVVLRDAPLSNPATISETYPKRAPATSAPITLG